MLVLATVPRLDETLTSHRSTSLANVAGPSAYEPVNSTTGISAHIDIYVYIYIDRYIYRDIYT